MDAILEEAIKAVIPSCHCPVAPPDADLPYVIWQRFGGESSDYLDNEDPQLEVAEVQLRIFSDDVLEPKRLMPLLIRALRAHPDLVIRPIGNFRDDYDHDMDLYSADQDIRVSY